MHFYCAILDGAVAWHTFYYSNWPAVNLTGSYRVSLLQMNRQLDLKGWSKFPTVILLDCIAAMSYVLSGFKCTLWLPVIETQNWGVCVDVVGVSD
jgi:hypothetical protein